MKRAVFLDRDGVIIRTDVRDGKPYAITSMDALEILDGAENAIRRLKDAGFVTVVVSNQPDVVAGIVNTGNTLYIEKGPRRIRDKNHLRFVASQNCLVCGRSPCQAHHILYAQPRAMSRKVSDEWTVPLCAIHHRALHDCGGEQKWWARYNIDPLKEASQLWRQSCGRDQVVAS